MNHAPRRKRPAHGVLAVDGQPTIVFDTVCTKNRDPWLARDEVQHIHIPQAGEPGDGEPDRVAALCYEAARAEVGLLAELGGELADDEHHVAEEGLVLGLGEGDAGDGFLGDEQ